MCVGFKKKRVYSITNYNEVNDFALSDAGRKSFASFVSGRHWDEFLKWYEDEFGTLPPGVVAQDTYVRTAASA